MVDELGIDGLLSLDVPILEQNGYHRFGWVDIIRFLQGDEGVNNGT